MSPAPVEAYVAPPSEPVVQGETPISRDARTSLATPPSTSSPPPKRNLEPVVEASGPLSTSQRDVLSAVALCAQKKVDKGQKLEARSIIVHVTVETSGAVSSVDLDGGSQGLAACAEHEIRKVRYPSTDDSAGVRVMQYPMDLSTQSADEG